MRWIIRIMGILVLVAALAVGAVLMLPADRIAKVAADQLSRATGREVRITGDVSMTFWPVLGVKVAGLSVGNADWASQDAMLTAEHAAIGLDAASLLRREITVRNIEVQDPVIRLQSRADGRANWQFSDPAGQVDAGNSTQSSAPPVTLQRLVIEGATLIYDAEGADRISIQNADLTLDWPNAAAAARIKAAFSPAGQPVTVEATVDRFGGFLDGDVQPIVLDLRTPGGEMGLKGRASLDGALAGALRVTAQDTSAMLAAFGAGPVDLPEGLGRVLNLQADLTVTPDQRVALRELRADLGGNQLSGAADIDLNGPNSRPHIKAQIVAGALDLRALTAGDGATGNAQGAGATGWSRAPIDASALASFDGAIALRAGSVDLGVIKLGATRSLLSNERSRMVFELREVEGYGGRLGGEFVMNNRNGLSVGGKLRADGVQLHPLLSDLADLTRFTGQGDAQVSFLGVGQSVDAIMRSLSGKGSLKIGRGSIEGIDLDDLLGSFDSRGGTTVFDALTASFTMDKGVLDNRDLRMLLPNFEATGAGQIGLGAQTLDYTVTPKALRVNKDRGLAVPVRIYGPWADPRIKADVKAALDLNFKEEKERAKDRAKQKLEEKLDQELGLVREEGQSVEEAVKDKLEEKLKQELLKIFD